MREAFSSYRELFVKVADFNSCIPPAFVAPYGVILFEFRRDLWHQKLESMGYCVALFA